MVKIVPAKTADASLRSLCGRTPELRNLLPALGVCLFACGACSAWAQAAAAGAESVDPELVACVPAQGQFDTHARIVARLQAQGLWSKRADSTVVSGRESLAARSRTPAADPAAGAAQDTRAASPRLSIETATVAVSEGRQRIRETFVPAAQGRSAMFCAQVDS